MCAYRRELESCPFVIFFKSRLPKHYTPLHLYIPLFIKRLRPCREHLLFCQFFAHLVLCFAITPHRMNTAVHLLIQDRLIFSHTTPYYIHNFITRHLILFAINSTHLSVTISRFSAVYFNRRFLPIFFGCGHIHLSFVMPFQTRYLFR